MDNPQVMARRLPAFRFEREIRYATEIYELTVGVDQHHAFNAVTRIAPASNWLHTCTFIREDPLKKSRRIDQSVRVLVTRVGQLGDTSGIPQNLEKSPHLLFSDDRRRGARDECSRNLSGLIQLTNMRACW